MAKKRLVKNNQGQYGILDENTNQVFVIDQSTKLKSSGGKYYAEKDGNRYNVDEVDEQINDEDINLLKKKDVSALSGPTDSTDSGLSKIGQPEKSSTASNAEAARRFILGDTEIDYSGLAKFGVGGEFIADILDVPANIINAGLRGVYSSTANQGMVDLSIENVKDRSKSLSKYQDIAENYLAASTLPKSDYYKRFEKGESDWFDKAAIIPEIIVESLMGMKGTWKSSVAGATVGAGIGAGVGTVFAPVTATLGAIGGAKAASTFVNEIGGVMQSKLQEKGVDTTNPEALQEAFKDESLIDEIRAEGIKRGAPIALIDMFTEGVAGLASRGAVKLASKAVRKAGVVDDIATVATRESLEAGASAVEGEIAGDVVSGATRVLTDKAAGRIASSVAMATEAVGGMLGEAVGQLASEGKLSDMDSIIMEGMADLGPSIPTGIYAYVKANQINRELNRQSDHSITSLEDALASMSDVDPGRPVLEEKIKALKAEKEQRNSITASQLEAAPVTAAKRILDLTTQIDGLSASLEQMKAAPDPNLSEDQQREKRRVFMEQLDELAAEREELLAEAEKAKAAFAETMGTPTAPLPVSGGDAFSLFDDENEIEPNEAFTVDTEKPLTVTASETKSVALQENIEGQETKRTGASVFNIEQEGKKLATALQTTDENGSTRFYVPELQTRFNTMDEATAAVKEKLSGKAMSESERSGINRILVRKGLLKTPIVFTQNGQQMQISNEAKLRIIKAQKALRSVSDANIYLYTSEDDYVAGIRSESDASTFDEQQARTSNASYVRDGNIHINVNNMNQASISHEIFHAALVSIASKNPQAFIDMRKRIMGRIKKNETLKVRNKATGEVMEMSGAEYLDQFSKGYSEEKGFGADVQAEEYLSELAGLMANNENLLADKTFIENVRLAIRSLMQKLNMDTAAFDELADATELVDFMKSFNESVQGGKRIKLDKIKAKYETRTKKSDTQERGEGAAETAGAAGVQETQEGGPSTEGVQTAVKRKRGNKTPTAKRKIKDKVLLRASEVDSSNLLDIVKQYFIKGGSIVRGRTKDISKRTVTPEAGSLVTLFTTKGAFGYTDDTKAMRARFKLTDSRENGALTIPEIAKAIAESEVGKKYKLVTGDIESALQDMLLEFADRKAMAQSVLDNNGISLEAEAETTTEVSPEAETGLTAEQEQQTQQEFEEFVAEEAGLTVEEFQEAAGEDPAVGEMQAAAEEAIDIVENPEENPEIAAELEVTPEEEAAIEGMSEQEAEEYLGGTEVEPEPVTKAKAKKGKTAKVGTVEVGRKKSSGTSRNKGKALSYDLEVETEDIEGLTVAQAAPNLDFVSLLNDGELTLRQVAAIKYLLSFLPSSNRFLSDSVNIVKTRKYIKLVIEGGDASVDQLLSSLPESQKFGFKLYYNAIETLRLIGKTELLNARSKYAITISRPWSGGADKIYITTTAGSTDWGIKNNGRFESEQDAINELVDLLSLSKGVKNSDGFVAFKPSGASLYRIGKFINGRFFEVMEKIDGILPFMFNSKTDADKFISKNLTKIKDLFEGNKYTKSEVDSHIESGKSNRVGTDWRGGKDVSSQDVFEKFGLRGVDFISGMSKDEKQSVLNDTYDALMDMAEALNVPAKALGLGGKIGIKYGIARDETSKGGAFRRNEYTIKLSRANIGSLAHEWWHALDNYFGEMGFGSYQMLTSGEFKNKTSKPDLRPEMLDAFKSILEAIEGSDYEKRARKLDSGSGYYKSKPIELSARAFERLLIYKADLQGKRNDFLAKLWDTTKETDADYEYLKGEELGQFEALFDTLFKTIKAKEEGNRTILYQSSGLEVEPRALGLTSDIIAASNEAQDNMAEDGAVTVRYQQKYGPIDLYHGSGWMFDKFSLDHLGKGEGAQMYGYGMYLSEDKDIATNYAKSNQGNKLKVMGLLSFLPKKLQNEAYAKLQGNISIKDWTKYLDENKGFLGIDITKSQREKLVAAYGYRNVYTVMYRPNNMTSLWLDWHDNVSAAAAVQIIAGAKKLIKPLHNQLKSLVDKNGKVLKGKQEELDAVRTAFQLVKILGEEVTTREIMSHTGSEFYGRLQSTFKSQKLASELLLGMGIDGNRVPVGYFINMQTGRPIVQSNQKFNYIVFDADRLKIMNRNTMRFQSEGADLALVDDAAEYKMVDLYGNPQEMLAHFESKFKLNDAANQKGFAAKLSKASRTIEGAISDNIMTRSLARVFGTGLDAIEWVGDAGFINITTGVDDNGNPIKQKVSFNYVWQKAFGMSEAKARELTLKGLEANNRFANIAANVATGLVKNLSITDRLQQQSREYNGYKANAHNLIYRLSKSLNGMIGFDADALRRVHSLLDPEAFADTDRSGLPSNPLELSVSELRLFNALRTMNDYIHEWHYKNGFLDKETYDKNKGKYFARAYAEIETKKFKDINDAMDSMIAGTDLSMFKQRKDFEMVELNLLEDPIYITCKRLAQMSHNQAIVEFANDIADSDEYATYDRLDDIPENIRKYYKKLDGFGNNMRFGNLTNKYVPMAIHEQIYGVQFAGETMSYIFDKLKKYDKLALRQTLKKSKTVYNPLARIGNIVSSFAFAFQGGVDPFSLLAKRPSAKDQLDSYGEYAQDLTKAGLIGTSGINQILQGLDENGTTYKMLKALKIPESALAKANDFDNMVKETYGKADDVAKLSMYMSLVQDRGKTKAEAIQIVAESMQNYNTVGKYFVLASMTPAFGNAFIRFKADATRILYNGISKRPLFTMAYIGMLWGVKELLSDMSGEDDEEKEAREERPFTTKWGVGPFALPMNWKIGNKEYNVARYLSPYYIYDQGYYGDDLVDASQYMPYQIQKLQPGKGSGFARTGYVLGFGDPFAGVLGQIAFDYDYKGNSIADPGASRFMPQTVSTNQQRMNQLTYAARSLGSPYYGWIADQQAAWAGKLDAHDRKRDPMAAAMNLIIKNEDIDSKILTEKYASHLNRMFKQHQAALDLIKVTRNRMYEDITKIQSNTELTPSQKKAQIEDIYDAAEEIRIEKHNEAQQIMKEAREPWNTYLKLKKPKK